MDAIRSHVSCGVLNIVNLGSPGDTERSHVESTGGRYWGVLKRFLFAYKGRNDCGNRSFYPIVVFSDKIRAKTDFLYEYSGSKLMRELRKFDPQGKTFSHKPVRNPNSLNRIQVFVWIPSDEARAKVRKMRA